MQTKCCRTGRSAHHQGAWPCAPPIWGEKEKVQSKLVVQLGAECRPALGMKSLCFHLHSSQKTNATGSSTGTRWERATRRASQCALLCGEGRARATLGRRHWAILKAQQVPVAAAGPSGGGSPGTAPTAPFTVLPAGIRQPWSLPSPAISTA